ncbi:hypothetical protein KC992_00935 [Candidatus Saccharibacteria bacterium]|nr:hypothetical protein [Candidatus Saccharibacteria bacterium]
MNELSDLLKQRTPQEPPQVAALKAYVKEKYNQPIQVQTNRTHYTIVVPGAALAGRLRTESAQITERCSLDKKLVIRIGY